MRLFRNTASSSSDSIDLSMEALFGPERPEKHTTAIHLHVFSRETRSTVRSLEIYAISEKSGITFPVVSTLNLLLLISLLIRS